MIKPQLSSRVETLRKRVKMISASCTVSAVSFRLNIHCQLGILWNIQKDNESSHKKNAVALAAMDLGSKHMQDYSKIRI